jgi:hypothetical protein
LLGSDSRLYNLLKEGAVVNSDEGYIEERLDRLVNLYAKLDELIDQLPIELPAKVRKKIKSALFENQDMTDLVKGTKNRRPPRFVLVGRSTK